MNPSPQEKVAWEAIRAFFSDSGGRAVRVSKVIDDMAACGREFRSAMAEINRAARAVAHWAETNARVAQAYESRLADVMDEQ